MAQDVTGFGDGNRRRISGVRVATIGECMIELAAAEKDARMRQLGFGGDSLNTATYLARLGVQVDYVTALGDDPYSAQMLKAWQDEGIGTGLVSCQLGRLPGLYMIEVDEAGERRFFYWRDSSPAREIFDNDRAGHLCQALLVYDWLYLTGISLSLYGKKGRDRLFSVLAEFRGRGGKVAFDTNYRARGWASAEAAREVFLRQLTLTDLALSSLEDEMAVHGIRDAHAALDVFHRAGVPLAVIKEGGLGCIVSSDGRRQHVPARKVERVVDATAAGDSFNAGFLAAHLGNAAPVTAAELGHACAAIVIGHHGAIVPREMFLPAMGR